MRFLDFWNPQTLIYPPCKITKLKNKFKLHFKHKNDKGFLYTIFKITNLKFWI